MAGFAAKASEGFEVFTADDMVRGCWHRHAESHGVMQTILAINGGSSTIRFAVYDADASSRKRLGGKLERVGSGDARLIVDDPAGEPQNLHCPGASDHRLAVGWLLDWLTAQPIFASVKAAGHRVVHGLKHTEPERITPKLMAELRRIASFAPEHLPRELELIEAFRKRLPGLPQVACFDTAFHCNMPVAARRLPIPRRYAAMGVERYGFHGLSYSYLFGELSRLDPTARAGRVIMAHLGNGASLAAVRRGRSIDTSMGFTPTAGLVMSTRSGDLDPGLLAFLAHKERMTPTRLDRLVNHESGLLGVSGTSSDMRDLLARAAGDARAAEAVELFCYQAKKWIGSFAAVLGGLDTLVFAGGIGENEPFIRKRICEGLGFLGVAVDRRRNLKHAPLISPDDGRVKVRVIRTDEELMIGKSVRRVLGLFNGKPTS